MTKPIIGITVDALLDEKDTRSGGKLTLNWNYAQAVADAGGVPVLIPPQTDATAMALVLDGLLIPGGNDIDAKHWGEENHPTVETIAEERFDVERRLYEAADPEMPIFGICYGCQFINVVRGGSLIQHLPDVVGHESDRGGTMQDYRIDADSSLAEIMGEDVQGQSWHHQAVKDLGAGLKVVAKNEDGVVEAIEAEDRPWMIGVQWHPERTTEDEATQRLFRNFVGAAAEFKAKRNRIPETVQAGA